MIGRVFWAFVFVIVVILNIESFVVWLKYILLAGVAIVVLGLAAAIGNAFLEGTDTFIKETKKTKKKKPKKIHLKEHDETIGLN